MTNLTRRILSTVLFCLGGVVLILMGIFMGYDWARYDPIQNPVPFSAFIFARCVQGVPIAMLLIGAGFFFRLNPLGKKPLA